MGRVSGSARICAISELPPSFPSSSRRHLHPSSMNARSTSQKNWFCCSWQKEVIQDAPESSGRAEKRGEELAIRTGPDESLSKVHFYIKHGFKHT